MVEVAPDVEEARAEVDADEQKSVSVGVLGWLGFIIVNLAAWGIVGVTTAISWLFGLGVCVLYIALLIGLAFWLERSGSVYKQFVNLLWVLAGWFVFIAGAYIAVNTIGRDGISPGRPYPSTNDFQLTRIEFEGGLQALLPSSVNAAFSPAQLHRTGADYIALSGSLFFNARVDGSTQFLRANGVQTERVGTTGSFLTIFMSKLYFVDANSRIYSIEGNNGNSSLAEAAFSSSFLEGDYVQGIFVDNDTMYYKVTRNCADPCVQWPTSIPTVFTSSDGVDSTDIRGDPCQVWYTLRQDDADCGTGDLGSSVIGGPEPSTLWGVIFLAAVPMLILSFVVLIRKKMPGLFFNIFGGIVAIVVMAYWLVHTQPTQQGAVDAATFFKWFFMIYTSVQWIALVVWSLVVEEQEEWLEDLKTWATGVVGMSFFITIHFVLEIPFSQEWWLWVTYGLLAFTQMLFSAVVKRTLPMVTGALAAFVLAWKVASEVSRALQISSYQMRMLALFGIIGLEGVGIILAAIAFARNRDAIQDGVRELFACKRCRQKKAVAL